MISLLHPVKRFWILICSVRWLTNVTERTRRKLTNTFLSIPAQAPRRLHMQDDRIFSIERPDMLATGYLTEHLSSRLEGMVHPLCMCVCVETALNGLQFNGIT